MGRRGAAKRSGLAGSGGIHETRGGRWDADNAPAGAPHPPMKPILALALLVLVPLPPQTVVFVQQSGYVPPPPPPGYVPPDPVDPYAIPGLAGRTVGRTVSGHFTGDDVLDLALLIEGEVLVLSGRELYLSFATAWTGVNDLDVIPAAGPDRQDGLVFTDASGLHLGWWDLTTHDFDDELVSAGAWAGSPFVRAGAVSGAGRTDVVGVSGSGSQVLVLAAQAPQPGLPLTFAALPGAGFTVAGESILALTTVEWNGVAPPEIALLTDQALRIETIAGADLVVQSTAGAPGGQLATLRQAGTPAQRLVWVTAEIPGPPATQLLYTFDAAGVDVPGNVSGVAVTSVTAGDWDGDGDDDIALGYQALQQIAVLENERSAGQPTGPSFPFGGGVTTFTLGAPATPNPGHVANAAFGDFDGDGDMDVASAVQATGELRIGRNALIDAAALHPLVTDLSYVVTESSPTGDLLLTIDRPLAHQLPLDEVEVIVWRQADLAGLSDPAPAFAMDYPVGAWPTQITIPIPEAGQYFESVYYLELGLAWREPGGAEHDLPATVGGFTLSPLSWDVLAQVHGAGEPLIVVPEGDLVFGELEVGALAGAYVPGIEVPPSMGLNHD